ncbi:MAG: serine/threonine protein kinase [Thermoguttaceae bacterium]
MLNGSTSDTESYFPDPLGENGSVSAPDCSSSDPFPSSQSESSSISENSREISSRSDRSPVSAREKDRPDLQTASSSVSSNLLDSSILASTEEVHSDDFDVPAPSGAFLPKGTVLGHFCITKFVGGGGMGRVYLGVDQSLDRNVAIKVLQKQRAQDQAAVARFMNEARSAARLNHEHIAQVYYAGQQDDIPFIAFEYVEGVNVRAMVEQQGVFPLTQALTYMIQIADALNHAASHGVIHRDVKPSNILITQSGRAKLIDMGLARLLKPTGPADDLTASGVTLGTFDYISPEQARDPRNADIRSDIYSLGCTFYYMLTAQPPFPEGTVLQKLLQHQGEEPPDVRAVQPNLPIEVSLLIQKMMSKDPRQRFQNPALLLQELTIIAEKVGLRPTGSGNAIWTVTEQRRLPRLFTHLPWIVGVLLLAIGVLFLKWFEGQHPEQIPSFETAHSGMETILDSEQPVPPVQPSPSPQSDTVAVVLWNGQEKVGENGGERGTEKVVGISGRAGLPRLGSGMTLRPLSSSLTSLLSEERGRVSSLISVVRPGWTSINTQMTDSVSSPTLVVDPNSSATEKGVYSTLQDAIAASGKRGTIELHFNGVLKMNTKAFLAFAGKQLRIQAGKDFSPVLLFRPTDSLEVKNGRMNSFFLNGGEVSFSKIAFELDVSPRVHAVRWSLFEILGPTQLEFSDCSFVIRNTLAEGVDVFHTDVAFFRVTSSGTTEIAGSQLGGGFPTNSALITGGAGHSTAGSTGSSGFSGPIGSTQSSGSLPSTSSQQSSGSFPSTGSQQSNGSFPSTSFAQSTGSLQSSGSTGFSNSSTTSNMGVGFSQRGIQDGSPYFRSSSSGSGTDQMGTEKNRGEMGPDSQITNLVNITLNNCILRGESTVLSSETCLPVRLTLNNAFVAISLPFFKVRELWGGNPKESWVQLILNHVSLYSKAPLSSIVKEKGAQSLPHHWTLLYSVIRLNKKPFAELIGFTSRDEAQRCLSTEGEGNFLQGITAGAEIKAGFSANPLEWTFEDWRRSGLNNTTVNADIFQGTSVLENRATNSMIPTDLAIAPRQGNPAYQSVPYSEENRQEKIDAGQIIPLLPKLLPNYLL